MCHISASHASRIVKLIFMMAGNSDSGRNNRIIGELLDRVEQLSEAISTRANSEVNEEVRRVFGRNQDRGDDTINTGDTESPEAARASQATSSRQDALPVRRGGAFGVRHYLPTRRQGARVLLSENGHVVTACQFTKGMSESQIEAKIMEAFDGKIPDLADVELLMSVHTALVVPNLHGTWSIDDVILHRLFKDKRVYVRPSRVYVLLLVLCFIESTISLFY